MKNPPAFTQPLERSKLSDEYSWLYGMTLRDYFAAKAMSGILSIPQGIDKIGFDAFATGLAESCYLYADAMLKAREQQ